MASDELIVPDKRAWRQWLERDHADMPAVLVVLAKKGTTSPTSLTYDEALEEALCHGWIDGQVRRRDTHTYFQRFTPRRRRSRWSKRNTMLVERFLAEGRMHPAGIAEMKRAQADGRWEARIRGPGHEPGAEGSRRSARRRAEGAGDVRGPDQPEPVRDPAPSRDREASGDASAQDQGVRRNARPRRDHPSAEAGAVKRQVVLLR